MIPLTIDEEEQFNQDESCHICSEPLGGDRVRDYCHVLGLYRGAAHVACNLNYQIDPAKWMLPVILHNLRGYDSHLIIKTLKKKYGRTRVIATNMEAYISFSVCQLQFLDSMQFTNSSLEKLITTLSREELMYTRESFTDANQFDLIQQKGVYPYDYMDNFNRFSETQLPPKNGFFKRLNDAHINDSQYEHAQRVWTEFQSNTLMDYHDVYLKSDVLLLADFFEKFRCACLSDYGLDPLHYYTTPGIAWDAALKMSRVNLELITDKNMYIFLERSKRGGMNLYDFNPVCY